MTQHLSKTSRDEIVASVRAAAVAVARMWDFMNAAETSSGEFDGTMRMVESLASELDSPPVGAKLDDETIWDAVEACWRTTR